MAALTQNEGRVYEPFPEPVYNDVPLAAGAVVFEGAYIGEDASTGYGRPLVSGDVFLGIAAAGISNAGGAAGDQVARVRQRGTVKLSVATATVASLGDTVNALNDNDASLAAGSALGKITRHVSGTICMVGFEAAQLRSL